MYVWWTAEEQSVFSEKETSATRHVPWQAGQPTARSRYTELSPGLGGNGGGDGGGGWKTMGGGEGDSKPQELAPLLEMADTRVPNSQHDQVSSLPTWPLRHCAV